MGTDALVAVDIGGSSAKIGIVDRAGAIADYEAFDLDAGESFERVLVPVIEKVRLLRGRSTRGLLPDVAVSLAGIPSGPDGMIVEGSRNLPGLIGHPVAAYLRERLRTPVFLRNDGICAASGEISFGAGRELESFVMFSLGTGVGGGIVLDRRRGAHADMACELGHICVVPEGRRCNCGGSGCLEQYASGPAIVTAYARKKLRRLGCQEKGVTPKDVFEACQRGDVIALEVVDDGARRIAQVAGGLVNAIGIKGVILGGGISESGPLLEERVRRHLPDFAWPFFLRNVRVVTSPLGRRAALLGAAALVLNPG